MAFTGFSRVFNQYDEFVERENDRLSRYRELEGTDNFDKVTDHDDDETDDYALYRLGII